MKFDQASLSTSIEPVKTIEMVEKAWMELESASINGFCMSWTWVEPWLRLVLPDNPVYVFTAKENGRLIAICFLTLRDTSRLNDVIKIRQVLLNECLDDSFNMFLSYNGLLIRQGYEAAAWRAFFDEVMTWHEAWDEILLCSIDEEVYKVVIDNNNRKLTIDLDKIYKSWIFNLTSDEVSGGDILAGMKRKSRQQIRQSLKKYQSLGEIVIDCAKTLEEANSYFDAMGELHTLRWQSVGKTGSFANANWIRFHQGLIAKGFERGHIQLLRVACGDDVLGYLYGHVYGDTVYMHQTGFAESENNAMRPGYLCHYMAMKFNQSIDIRYYDFLPDESGSYKRFFVQDTKQVYWLQIQRPKIKFRIENLLRKCLGRPKIHEKSAGN